MGRWRREVKPGAARQEDIFLHLIQVGDRKLKNMSEAKVTTSSPRTEVAFTAGGKTVALSFAATGKVGGHVRITRGGQVMVDRDLTKDVMPQTSVATVNGDR
jgi:heparin/heparan-sulfate lyase